MFAVQPQDCTALGRRPHPRPLGGDSSSTSRESLIEAATFLAEAKLLISRQRRDCMSLAESHLLLTVAEALQQLILPLQQVARAQQPAKEALRIRLSTSANNLDMRSQRPQQSDK